MAKKISLENHNSSYLFSNINVVRTKVDLW